MDKTPEMNFTMFLLGLGQQVMVDLGKVEHPLTKETKTNLPSAKSSIDLMAVLEEKTRGNLDASEKKLLESLLAQLRLLYVETSKDGSGES